MRAHTPASNNAVAVSQDRDSIEDAYTDEAVNVEVIPATPSPGGYRTTTEDQDGRFIGYLQHTLHYTQSREVQDN